MAKGILLKFDASHHALVALLVLEATLVLPIALVLFVKIQGQGTKIILLSCAAYLADVGIDLAAAQHLQPTFHRYGLKLIYTVREAVCPKQSRCVLRKLWFL